MLVTILLIVILIYILKLNKNISEIKNNVQFELLDGDINTTDYPVFTKNDVLRHKYLINTKYNYGLLGVASIKVKDEYVEFYNFGTGKLDQEGLSCLKDARISVKKI